MRLVSLAFLALSAAASAAPTQNLQFVVQYKGSLFGNPEKTVAEVRAKEQKRFLITDVESDHKEPAFLVLRLTDRERNKRFTKRMYFGHWTRADLVKRTLLGKAQVTLYDPIHTYSHVEMKIGTEGRTDVMPLPAYIRAAEREALRKMQLETGFYGGNLLQRIFDWYYGVGVFQR
jgi:hypothetical protein